MRFTLGLFILLFSFNAMAIEDDKAKHLAVSTAIGGASTYFIEDYRYSLALCLSVGLTKELYDKVDYGDFSGKDLAYDALGCGLGVMTGEYIKFKIRDDSVGITFNYNF